MQLRDRFIVADPDGLDASLANAAQDAGAWALIDATRPTERDKLADVDADRTMIRVRPDATPTPHVAVAVLAPWSIQPEHVPELEDAIQAWNQQGVPAAVEVRTKEEARRAVDAGADLLVARGVEGPGRVSERSNLVLLPALSELDVPLIAWGGAGPNATGALFVHADAVILGAQLYLLEEAGLPDAWERSLGAFDGSDVKQLGNTLDEPYHVHARVADEHVHDVWEQEQADERGKETRRSWLRSNIEDSHAGFDEDPGTGLRPLGHDAAHASFFERFGTVEDTLLFLEDRVTEQLDAFALEEGNALAQEHGTRYPIVQGAMANVSEIPAFAKEVADAGALPFLAFAALREEWAREALEGTLDELDPEQPFGCGIIGLDVNAQKRDAHIRLMEEHEPPYALIAAGTAEQALSLENEGIDTYLHTPSRGIVRQALDMGLERIVVEGNECGGHIGKLPSLVLWDQALQEVDEQGKDGTMVLLAGGIGDADSSAMAGTLASGTGARVGALMGTAYLATEEIVETGAIPDSYQNLVLAAKDTEVTGRTTGIRSRSALTPFTKRITEYEQELLQAGVPLEERQEKVERKNLGSTRLAARRLKRDDDGTYHKVPVDEQLHEGNFLMGQGAELIEERYTVQDLHERVTDDASHTAHAAKQRLEDPFALPAPGEAAFEVDPDAVAIVGLGCVLPDADDVDAFWSNLMDGRVSIQDLPEDRWPVPGQAHYDPDGDEGTYTLLGGFVEDPEFDPIEYRIPPAVADQMDPAQKWTIQATEQALEDAGLEDVEDRDQWAVILGNAQGGEERNWSDRRVALREARAHLESTGASEDAIEAIEAMLDNYKPITEDTMPGELSNVIASRVCNLFDIGGPARTVDTACASSLAAAEEAVRQLRDGAVDVAITGGVDRSMHPAAYTKFSAIGALSSEGSFPFDERASGFVMGEGCGILVLKRLTDALEAGDQVYAVIEGVGSSSDGSGKGITAPNPEGQARAIRRAWEDAGTDPSSVAFMEAHGTGTPVGDPTEASTLAELLDGHAEDVALGSVKANIGHLKSAAGAAGLLKTALSIHHRRLPPTPVEEPTSRLDWDEIPLTVADEPLELPQGTIRAGVSAFGFGGTNSHVVLSSPPTSTAVPTEATELPLHVISGNEPADMEDALETEPEAWSFDEEDAIRVAVHEDADKEDAEKLLEGELPPGLALRKGIAIAMGDKGKLGLVFPGQGSQYPGMILDLADEHPAARDVLEEADQVLAPLIGRPLSEILELEGEKGQQALTPTEVCQPAVLTCDIAILRVLEEHGVEPDVVAGHSLGEYAALVAAGVLEFEDALLAVSARGEEMADVAEEEVDDPGGLVAVRAGPDTAHELIDGLEAWPANLNGPEQTVLAGTTSAIETIQERAEEQGVKASQLPVSAAFHSPIVEPATDPLRKVLDRIPVDPPEIPVIANTTAEPYPEDPDAIRQTLAEQVASPVQWMDTMETFQDLGVDLLVETGPKPILTGLARENLPETMSVPTAHPREGAKDTLEIAFLALAAHGHLDLPTGTDALPVQPRDQEDDEGPTRVTGPTPTTRGRDRPTRHASSTDRRNGDPPEGSTVVVSGVSVGLPSPEPDQDDPFSREALEGLLAGDNRITDVPDPEKGAMASMGVTRLVKDEDTGPRMVDIDDEDEVVQLAGRIPNVNLASYEADEDWLADADPTSRLGVAAALEALTDAKIPLVPDARETSTGTTLTDGWVLPEALQDETGVIFASAFPGYASLIDILQRQRPSTPQPAPSPSDDAEQDRLTSFLADLVPKLEDRQLRKTALDLLVEHADGDAAGAPPREATNGHDRRATTSNGEAAGFPRDFLFRTLAMGHAQIAQLIQARGPNVQVNAACASTTSAVAMAKDWIEQGRCERVIVVGADVAGNQELLPFIGSGFLAAGAASTSEDVDEAALPFDERRHGMLVGSGAVGLVVETEEAARERGVTPLAEIVHAHVANSAYHGARLDPEHVADQVTRVVDEAQHELGLSDRELAQELVFVSHEPATPARGGSAEAEVQALRDALGDAASDVLVTNTKGLTGHAMGAGIEDAIAVELLRARKAPPVANLERVDPDFEDLTFSTGAQTDRGLSMRFAAGFGSQVAVTVFQRTAKAPGSLDEDVFGDWLDTVIGDGFETANRARCLRALPQDEAASTQTPEASTSSTTQTTGTQQVVQKPPSSPDDAPGEPEAAGEPEAPADRASGSNGADARPDEEGVSLDEVETLLTELVSKKTGYPEDVIEPEMDLEADLGVDTVKQAEVLSQARTELDIPPIEGLSLSDVPTLREASQLLAEHIDGDAQDQGEGTDPSPERTDEDPDESVRVLGLRQAPAPAGEILPEGTRVQVEGTHVREIEEALTGHGAKLVDGVDDADVVALGLERLEARAGALADVLERLQEVPEGTRIVLVAPDEAPWTGLPALAGTLRQEGWPTRAVVVKEGTPAPRIAEEVLLDVEESVLLSASSRRSKQLSPTGEPAPVDLEHDAVVLAPGGLGAAVLPCLERLAQEQTVRLAMAGRSPLEEPTVDPSDEEDIARLRQELLEEARSGKGPVKPAEVEKKVQRRVKRARRWEAYQRLDDVAAVRYDRVDATDPDALAAWADEVEDAWETPRLIVHGAGVDDSRAFEEKTRETMHTVLDVKLTPVRVLTDRLASAHHVAFGSIAGVTGNLGQADYALANGTLEALLEDVGGTVLHWTAWDAAGGMADDDTIRTVLEERDVAFLDPDEGARVFTSWAGTKGTFAVANLPAKSPLLPTNEGAHLSLEGSEDWLQDHKVGDRPLLPGVRHLQSMVEAAAADGRRVEGLSTVRFERPLWVTGPTEARVVLEEGHAWTEKEGTVHARARLDPGDGTKPVPEDPLKGARELDREDLYEALFHGPTFQVLEEARVTEDRVHATADLGAGGAAPWLMALEAGMQAAGVASGDEHALPVGVEALERGSDPASGTARVDARLVREDAAGSTWDVTVRSGDEIAVTARGVRLVNADAMRAITDATVELSNASGVTVKATTVGPHDPRDPRAKQDAEHEASREAAERALTETHGPDEGLERLDSGQPVPASGQGAVSLTHGEGLAAAATHAEHERVGVDVERIEPREDAWLEDAFSGEERERILEHELSRAGAATRAWTVKEAVSKALGTGLSVPLKELEVTFDGERVLVETPEGRFEAWSTRVLDAVLTVAVPAR